MKYQSIFFMPRGFANEGTYIYGGKEEIQSFLNGLDYCVASFGSLRQHRLSGAAFRHCRAAAQKDIKTTPQHEICAISYCHISELGGNIG